MDSSHPQRTSSNRKRKAQDSIMVISKHAKFMETYHRQNFSMPDSVIFYIAKNPKTAELYLKMVKTCKYFFVKNPIIIIPNLYASYGKWSSCNSPLNLTKYNCKCWITNSIAATAYEFVDKNIFSPIISKFYRCDVKHVSLHSQIVSFDDLSFIISSAEKISLNHNVVVRHADSSDVPLEDIVAVAIKAYEISVIKPIIIPKTMKELTKLPNFTKLDYFSLYNLSEVFNIDVFYGYMKKNHHTQFFLTFDEQISDAFKNRLETIVDEILEPQQFNYKPPVINFTGLDFQKHRKLYRIYYSH